MRCFPGETLEVLRPLRKWLIFHTTALQNIAARRNVTCRKSCLLTCLRHVTFQRKWTFSFRKSQPRTRQIGKWADITCWYHMLTWHVVMTCWHDMLTWHVDITCWHDMLTWHVVMTCWHDMLTWRADMTCWHDMLAWHVDMTCWHDMLTWELKYLLIAIRNAYVLQRTRSAYGSVLRK